MHMLQQKNQSSIYRLYKGIHMKSKGYKYTLLLSGFIAIIGTGNYLLFKTTDTPSEAKKTITQENMQSENKIPTSSISQTIDLANTEDPNTFIKNIDERLSRITARQDISAYSEQEILNAVNNPKVWSSTNDVASSELPLDDRERSDGRSFFEANPARIALSIPGDTLEVFLPNSDIPMELSVEQVSAPGNGVVSLSGQIVNSADSLDGTFNVSQGNNIIAGHINTSTNTYSFEVYDTHGWIHESGALFTEELSPLVDEHELEEAPHLGQEGEHIIANSSTSTSNQANDNNSNEE